MGRMHQQVTRKITSHGQIWVTDEDILLYHSSPSFWWRLPDFMSGTLLCPAWMKLRFADVDTQARTHTSVCIHQSCLCVYTCAHVYPCCPPIDWLVSGADWLSPRPTSLKTRLWSCDSRGHWTVWCWPFLHVGFSVASVRARLLPFHLNRCPRSLCLSGSSRTLTAAFHFRHRPMGRKYDTQFRTRNAWIGPPFNRTCLLIGHCDYSCLSISSLHFFGRIL